MFPNSTHFSEIQLECGLRTNGRTDERTDGRMDTPSYRDARTNLEIRKKESQNPQMVHFALHFALHF